MPKLRASVIGVWQWQRDVMRITQRGRNGHEASFSGGRGGREDACRRYTFINVNDDTPEMKTKIQNKHGHGRTRKSPIHVMLSEIPSRRADHLKIASY